MILGFKKRFTKDILNGAKIHTIRADKKKRWKIGKAIHFSTGVRTKKYKQFMVGRCIGIQNIHIVSFLESVYIDDKELTYNEIISLARNDGFGGLHDFFEWFHKDFTGIIIHWSDFLYK